MPSADERALLEDLPFDMPADLADLEAATTILANRDIDLGGVEPGDLTRIAVVQADPALQPQNCLRRAEHDEPDGARRALDACREVIRGRAMSAVNGLGPDGFPDGSARVKFDAVLTFRGSVSVSLPRFWVEIGRALHTLQDGFSHTYRVPDDQRQVVTVQNFIDEAEGRLDEARDGPVHTLALDECTDLDTFRAERLALAEQASHELLRAALDPAPSAEERQLRVDAVLDEYLSLAETTCSARNAWCNAPERSYETNASCLCAAAPLTSGAGPRKLVPPALLLLFFARRARRRAVVGGAVTFLICSIASHAEAAPEGGQAEPSRFGGELAAGGSITHGALAFSLGARYRASPRFLLGADAEYNPWFSLSTGDVRSGTTNLYATGILRFPMRAEPVAIRSTLELGIARMNFHLTGVPEGSVGPFIGFNLLGIDYRIARSLYLIFNPAHIAIPMPQTATVPFAYMQYRITLGLQYGA